MNLLRVCLYSRTGNLKQVHIFTANRPIVVVIVIVGSASQFLTLLLPLFSAYLKDSFYDVSMHGSHFRL